MPIRRMQIAIPDEDVADLRRRLRATRWPPPVAGSAWADGTDGEYLRDLVEHLREARIRDQAMERLLALVEARELQLAR